VLNNLVIFIENQKKYFLIFEIDSFKGLLGAGLLDFY